MKLKFLKNIFYELVPIKNDITSIVINSNEKDVKEIHVGLTTNNEIITFWHCNNLLAKLHFLIYGNINLIIRTMYFKPTAMSIGNIISMEKR